MAPPDSHLSRTNALRNGHTQTNVEQLHATTTTTKPARAAPLDFITVTSLSPSIPTGTSGTTTCTSRPQSIYTTTLLYYHSKVSTIELTTYGHFSNPPRICVLRPCEIPPVDSWKPDVDDHDTSKVNGLDFPATIRQSKFSGFKDIEGMDPLQVPLWKFLYQGLQNTWLRRIAYMEGKLLCFHSTTLEPRFSLPSWSANLEPGTSIWTNWLPSNFETQATTSLRKRLHNSWPRKLPS